MKFTTVIQQKCGCVHVYLGPHLTLGCLQYFNYFFVTFPHCNVQSCFSNLMGNYMNAVKWEWYNSPLK